MGKAFEELEELAVGLDRIDAVADKTLIAMQGDTAIMRHVQHIPVVLMDEIGHSCRDPKNCKLNTTDHPYWCMISNDRAHERAE